jgi:hypothetical protein
MARRAIAKVMAMVEVPLRGHTDAPAPPSGDLTSPDPSQGAVSLLWADADWGGRAGQA